MSTFFIGLFLRDRINCQIYLPLGINPIKTKYMGFWNNQTRNNTFDFTDSSLSQKNQISHPHQSKTNYIYAQSTIQKLRTLNHAPYVKQALWYKYYTLCRINY